MSEQRWPLVILLGVLYLAAIAVLLGLAWIVAASSLPEWLKYFLFLLLGTSGLFGGAQARRRYRAGANPWSLRRPERG